MFVFGSGGKGVVAWGPSAAIGVKVSALDETLVDDSWVLTDVRIGAREIVDIRQCFNDVSYIYALGNDQKACSISLVFVIFLGAKNCLIGENTAAIASGLKKYESNRISRHTSPLNITIGGFSCKCWLSGVSIGNADPSRSICRGVLDFVMQLERNGK